MAIAPRCDENLCGRWQTTHSTHLKELNRLWWKHPCLQEKHLKGDCCLVSVLAISGPMKTTRSSIQGCKLHDERVFWNPPFVSVSLIHEFLCLADVIKTATFIIKIMNCFTIWNVYIEHCYTIAIECGQKIFWILLFYLVFSYIVAMEERSNFARIFNACHCIEVKSVYYTAWRLRGLISFWWFAFKHAI